MRRARFLRRLPAVIVTSLVVAAFFGGCGTEDDPVFDNPFDPLNPESTDPFGLVAFYGDGAVTLSWTTPVGPVIDAIVIESIAAGQPSDIDTVAGSATTYTDVAPLGNTQNEYRLRALDATGLGAQTSHTVSAAAMVPPLIAVGDGTGLISTSWQDISVGAVQGDVVQLDTLGDFSSVGIEPVIAGEALYPGFRCLATEVIDGQSVPTCTLFARAGLILDDGGDPFWSSLQDTFVLTLLFDPGLSRDGGGLTVAAPEVDVSLNNAGLGVTTVRFATSPAGLESAPWLDAEPLYPAIALRDTPNPQALYAEFTSDFGFLQTTIDSLVLRGDDLSAAGFSLDVSADRVVEDRLVPVVASAVATEMRLSTRPDFRDAPWRAYTRESEIELTGPAGPYLVYAQFRNHWFQSAVLAEDVILSGTEVTVAITEPADSTSVSGGKTVDVAGVATAIDPAFDLTAVEVHLGDGWQSVATSEEWSTTWDVPLLTVDTPWLVGVRATAFSASLDSTITGIAWNLVTISQLTVAIDDPADGAEVETGTSVSIGGFATADISSAPLDSVKVMVSGETLTTTTNLTGWEVEWDAPAVESPTETGITAWAYAGADSVQDSITVTLVPPPVEEEGAATETASR